MLVERAFITMSFIIVVPRQFASHWLAVMELAFKFVL